MGEPSETPKKIIDLRSAEVIKIKGADGFFTTLTEKVEALDAAGRVDQLLLDSQPLVFNRLRHKPQQTYGG